MPSDFVPTDQHDESANADDGIIRVDPTSLTGGGVETGTGNDSGNSGTSQRRRGRPPGSRNASKTSDNPANLKGIDIADILISIHALLAIRLQAPEWELSKEEAKRLDDAVKRVQRHYPLAVTQKQLDIAMALYVVADVYGTRIVTTVVKAKTRKKKSEPENVVPFAFNFPQPSA